VNITLRLGGKKVREALTNGHTFVLVMDDGSEAVVVWVDDNGLPIKGKPLLLSTGARMRARGLNELLSSNAMGLRQDIERVR